jgi:hypothetical protein
VHEYGEGGGVSAPASQNLKAVLALYFVWSLYDRMFLTQGEKHSTLQYADRMSYAEDEEGARKQMRKRRLETYKAKFSS